MSQIFYLEIGSIPEVGSSKNITLDYPINEIAKLNFLLVPPERFLASFKRSLFKSHLLII
jgi:hypothetical protein